jgi:hypothetical protein
LRGCISQGLPGLGGSRHRDGLPHEKMQFLIRFLCSRLSDSFRTRVEEINKRRFIFFASEFFAACIDSLNLRQVVVTDTRHPSLTCRIYLCILHNRFSNYFFGFSFLSTMYVHEEVSARAKTKWSLVFKKLPPYTLAGFDLTTSHLRKLRRYHARPRRQGNEIFF